MPRKVKSSAATAPLPSAPAVRAPSSSSTSPSPAAEAAAVAAAAVAAAAAAADEEDEEDEDEDEEDDEGDAGESSVGGSGGAGGGGGDSKRSRGGARGGKAGRAQLWDALSYKQLLDEALTGVLEEGARLEEDSSYSNAKLAVMAVASLSALVAQFYPLPFPQNRALLGACVLVYFGLSGVYQVMASFLDRDYVYAARARRRGAAPGAATGAATGRAPVVLRSMMEKHSDVYRAVVECPSGREVARLERSVGAYFTARGAFAERAFERDVRRLLLPALVALDPSVVEEARRARAEAEAKEAAAVAGGGKLMPAAAS